MIPFHEWHMLYILDGKVPVPCDDALKWGEWFSTSWPARRVAEDWIDGVRVSTVFISVNHAYGRGVPILFETMVFTEEATGTCRRYTTWDEALAGHRETVAETQCYQLDAIDGAAGLLDHLCKH